MRHVWSVFCSRAVIDADTNNVTLVEVLEALQIAPPIPPLPGILQLPCELVTLWSRQDLATAEQGTARARLMAPDGHTELHTATYTVDLGGYPRIRHRLRLNGVPITGEGLHIWEVAFRAAPEDEWGVRASVPLHISFLTEAPAQ